MKQALARSRHCFWGCMQYVCLVFDDQVDGDVDDYQKQTFKALVLDPLQNQLNERAASVGAALVQKLQQPGSDPGDVIDLT